MLLAALVLLPTGFSVHDSRADSAADAPALEEIRVIGRRDTRYMPVKDIASAVATRESQVSLNRTVGDWIEAVPGVSLNGQGGLFQSYSVRGFSRGRVRTEIDGVPILTDRRAGNSASFVPPELLGSVRVDKSAASVLYGSGAMGGVVSLNSARPAGLSVTLEGRSNDRQAALTALAGDGRGRVAGLSLRRAGRGSAADGEALDTGFQQFSALLAGLSQHGDLELSYRWLPALGRDIGKSSSLFPEQRISRYPNDRHSIASLELRRGGDWLLRGYHHYQDWEAEVLRVGERRNLTRYRAQTVGGLAQLAVGLAGAEGLAGLEWVGRRGVAITDREYTIDGAQLFAIQPVAGDEDTVGAFLNQRWTGERLALTGSVRADRLRQSNAGQADTDTQGSASLAAAFALSRDWRVRMELSSGYRFPGLSERYFNGVTPRGEVRGNPDLRPEMRRSAEFGFDYAPPGSGLSLRSAAYYSDLTDYIERYAVGARQLSYRNLDAARLYGAEIDLRYRAGAVSHRLTYQWQDGEDAGGRVLADLNPPDWRYRLRWQLREYSVASDLQYRQQRDDFGAEEAPLDAAWIWNLRFRRALGPSWSGELFLTNVLDEAYRGSADEQAPLQPGRAVGLRIRWQRG